MLTKFDWLGRCRSGTELLATLLYFSEIKNDLPDMELGAPFSAIGKVCLRCKIYEPESNRKKQYRYCKVCRKIIFLKQKVVAESPKSVVIWGYVNQIPQRFHKDLLNYTYGMYLHDDQRFLVMIKRSFLKLWLQELVIYSGIDLKGLLQIFPTIGEVRNLNMGDYLSWAIHHEANFSMDQLRVRFYTSVRHLINPKKVERQGLLTYTLQEFISLLELVEVFRAKLLPHEQEKLFEILKIKDSGEKQFYWGRFLGQLSQEARDMLSAWKIKQWSINQVNLLIKLTNYVTLPQST